MDIADRLAGLSELLRECNAYILRMDSLMRRVEASARSILDMLEASEIPAEVPGEGAAEDDATVPREDMAAVLKRLRRDHGKLLRRVRGLVATTTQTEGSLPILRRIEEISKARDVLLKQWEDKNTLMNELRRAHEELVSLDQMKSHFIDIASHELRTPLSTIQGFVELLQRGNIGALSERQAGVIDVVAKNVRRLSFLVLNIVNLEMLGRRAVNMEIRTFDVRLLLDELSDELEVFLAQRHQELSVHIDPSLSGVVGDRKGIHSVCVNLLLNAIRFTPDGGRIGMRAVPAEPGEDGVARVRIEVEDTGIGIPESERGRIFESFYEIQDPAHHHSGLIDFKSGGLGLGLTIVKRILAEHGCSIEVQSEVGSGSTFSFVLPAGDGSADTQRSTGQGSEKSLAKIFY